MKRTPLLLLFGVSVTFFVPSLIARAPQQATHAPSGGTQVTVISIVVPPLPNAPFTATVSTEWKSTLEDGSTITVKNHRTIARDNNGRIFQERRNLYPEGDPRESQIRQLEFADPSTHAIYYCWPVAQACEIHDYFARPGPPALIPAGPLDNGKRFLTRVDLGKDVVSGVEAIGTRETLTINPGAIGNDRAISVVKEFWYSQQLGINLIEKREDPREGAQNFVVSQITLGEPDARLFEMPASFKIVDMRKNAGGVRQDSGSN
ncbi:MAG TPA: hypothetical protein VN822_07760 [Candidatus Acidoferrales bacterium]|nr:hypothetical protein [Candidatus Acidoferrales bacterium]